MTRRALFSLFLCFGSCGGQSGTEVPLTPSCVEDRVEVLASPESLPEGFDFTAASVLALSEGLWQGSFVDPSGLLPPAGAQLSLTYEGAPIRVVRRTAVGFDEDGALSVASQDVSADLCPPRYEIPLALTLDTDDGALAESLSIDLLAETGDLSSLTAQLSPEQVLGQSRPQTFDPAEFDQTALTILAFIANDQLSGEATWSASREEPAEQGSSVVVGVFEVVGSFTLTRE